MMMRGILLSLTLLLTAACSEQTTQDRAAKPEAEATAAVSATAAVPQVMTDAAETVDPGEAYLHINSMKPGVKVMASGLQFEILSQGDGRSPGPTSSVVTHYTGKFINGDVFDSSVERGQPAEFPVNRVIAGWTEALQMMKEGDKWRLVLPPELAYGERGAGDTIPPNSVLVFEVELIEVKN